MNTTVMSASQAFNTVLPYLSFDESTPSATALGQYGGSVPTFEAAPAGAGGNALKIVKPTGSDVWAGAYFTVPRVPFTATQKTITAKVYSSVANAVIKLKVEVPGGSNLEVSGTPVATANTWTTVTWDFSGIDLTAQYTVLAVTPDATRATDGAIYYVDDIQIVDTPVAPVTTYLSFDESPASATALGQYGGSVPTIDAAPAGAGGNALKIVKPTGSDVWAGAYFTVPRVPFTATQKAITAKVYSSVANAVIKLKVEVVGGGNVEVSGTPVATANTWTTVTWDFSGIDLTAQYTVLAVTPDATRATDGATYYVDDLQLINTPAAPAPVSFSRVSFDEATAPKLTDFGTNTTPPEIATDPVDNTNKVLKVYKAPGSEQWAGVTVSTGASDSIATIPFSATAKSMTLRVYSPAAGVRIRLKVENAGDNTITCETDALTTTANAWETLTFNFANPGANPPVGGGPTAALDLTKTYNKASIFSDFGLGNGGGTLPASRTYYFDNLTFTAP
jgi:hypothetical protein